MSTIEHPVSLESAGVDRHEESEESSRGRAWWIVVLLLLFLLLACALLHLMFPGPRGAVLAPQAPGLHHVFSIYGLNEPRGVSAGPDGSIAISDTGAQRAYLYAPNGVLLTRLGGDMPADRVFSVAGSLYEEGFVYLCDWGLNRVWVFGEDGVVVDWFPRDPMAEEFGPGGFFPYDIQRHGDDLLTATRTGLFLFDGTTLEPKGRFGPDKVGEHLLDHVTGLAVDPESGEVYAVDSFNRRVIAFDAEGSPRWSLGRADEDGRIVSLLSLPRDVVVTERGILVSDAFKHELHLLDTDGSLLGYYGSRGVGDGEFNFPEGLAIAHDGLLYVADRANDRVQVLEIGEPIRPRGEVETKWEQDHVRY